jgi:hypothetical protein
MSRRKYYFSQKPFGAGKRGQFTCSSQRLAHLTLPRFLSAAPDFCDIFMREKAVSLPQPALRQNGD